MSKNTVLVVLIVLGMVAILVKAYPSVKEEVISWIQETAPSINIEMLNVK